jgi:hypothetical protein
MCGDSISTKGARKHFFCKHPFYEAPIRRFDASDTTSISDFFPAVKGAKEIEKDRLVALFFGTTSTSLAVVENKYFCRLVKGVKRRDALRRDILAEATALQSKVISTINQSPSTITVSIDIATTRSMRESYLGMVAHFWDGNSFRTLGLDLVTLKQRHTAEYIKEMTDSALATAGIKDKVRYIYI